MSIATSTIQPAPNFAALLNAQEVNADRVARLKDTYGFAALQVAALDETEVARMVAMLDFLSNNLPAASQESWLDRMLERNDAAAQAPSNQNSANLASVISASAAQPISRMVFGGGKN